jgi:hypothetical protein
VAGRSWPPRALLLLPLVWIFWRYLRDRAYRSIFDGLTLGLHEAGHAAFFWLGNDLLTTAGGTIFQIGLPLVAALYLLLRQRDPFGAAVGTFWMGTALMGAGVHAAGLLTMALSLGAAVWVLTLMAGSEQSVGRPGVRLWEEGEGERLGDFLAGRAVEREVPRRMFKRERR